MNKKLLTLLLVVAVIVLTLVGLYVMSNRTASAPANNSTGAGNMTPLLLPEQLLIGTFKLEGMDNAVDSNEAAALLLPWQAYKQLLSSSTSAQAEIDAVVSQIQDTMKPEQIQAITAMKLTQQDMFTTMSDLGLAPNLTSANSPPSFSGTPGFNPGGEGGFVVGAGGLPGAGGSFDGGAGGPSGAGGGFDGGTGGGQGFDPAQVATLQAARAQSGRTNSRFSQSLLNALIDLLQKRAQS